MSPSNFPLFPAILNAVRRGSVPGKLVCALLTLTAAAHAKIGAPASVGYAPLDQTVEGNIPFVQSVVFTITAPFAASNVGFEVASCLPGGIPTVGGPGSQYLSLSPTTLSFSAAGDVKQVVVTFTSPALGVVPAGEEVNYAYQIKAINWGADIANPLDHVSINATATAPLPAPTANPPVVKINPPLTGSVYTVSAGQQFPISIPFSFTVTSTTEYPVISADALFDGNPIHTNDDATIGPANAYTSLTITNIGTAVATGTASLKVYRPGNYSVFARGANDVGPATDISIFTVVASGPPPVVTISEPLAGSTYVIPANATSVTVPFNFLAQTTTGGVIREIIVKVDGADVSSAITSGALNSTLSVAGTTAVPLIYGTDRVGNHKISVTAKNEYGEDTATTNFNIAAEPTPPTGLSLGGVVFLDIDQNGIRNNSEPVLPGVTVRLFHNGTQKVVSADPAGTYLFNLTEGGDYELDVDEPAGMVPTNTPVTLKNLTASRNDVNLGLALNLPDIGKMSAGGFTIGYWKNNIEKAIAGKTGGTQVSAKKISDYTSLIAVFALSPFDGLTREGAVVILGKSTSVKAELLEKQLLASEYNYENGGYIGGAGGMVLTRAFVTWGEWVRLYGNDAECTKAQQWFDAYNNSHGGVIGTPK